MKRGRPPIPTHLRLLRGNPAKMPLPPGTEPQPRGYTECPGPPTRLKDEARDEWNRIAPELFRLGLLTQADIRTLALYCDAYGEWCDARDALFAMKEDDPQLFGFLVRNANGNLAANPIVKILAHARMQMERFGLEFGLTPASRSRLTSKPLDEPDRKFDGLLA
jgi:P27 family predicted phage terminase small subunit